MKNKTGKWTPQELKRLVESTDIRALATELGRSYNAVINQRVRVKARGVGISQADVPAAGADVPGDAKAKAPTEYSADKVAATEKHWKAQHDALAAKYKAALKDAALTEKLVEEIKSMAPQSYETAPSVSRPRKESHSSPQSAVLLFSDTHIGKVTLREQTLGFSEYNFHTFLARLKYVEDSVVSILRDHITTEVPELVIPMLGDMLDGALSHGVEAGQRNTLFSQFYAGGHAIAQFFRNLAAHVPKVRIQTVCGNHTRWQNQRRMPTENRFSNLDMFLYALVEALTSDIPNIEWNLNQQPFQVFGVQGFTFFSAHGDHWRGGDKALGIPNHAIGRQLSTTSQLFNKHNAELPNYYVSGHLHRSITLPHAIGEVMINGGFPGLDNFGLAENFNPVDPIQRFFFVHPRYGRTASYDLTLKHAEAFEGNPPYSIPQNFPVE
jgi:hypothetical protein